MARVGREWWGATGKLREVAAAWARRVTGKRDASKPTRLDAADVEAFAALGVTVEADPVTVSDDIVVARANAPVVEAFVALATQWRCLAFAYSFATEGTGRVVRTGLDYAALDVVCRRRGLDDRQFEEVRLMEAEALAVFAEG